MHGRERKYVRYLRCNDKYKTEEKINFQVRTAQMTSVVREISPIKKVRTKRKERRFATFIQVAFNNIKSDWKK